MPVVELRGLWLLTGADGPKLDAGVGRGHGMRYATKALAAMEKKGQRCLEICTRKTHMDQPTNGRNSSHQSSLKREDASQITHPT